MQTLTDTGSFFKRHSPEITGCVVLAIYCLFLERAQSDWNSILFTCVILVGFLTYVFVPPFQNPTRYDLLLAAVTGFVIGLVARKLWQVGIIGRLILIGLLVINSCGFLYYAFLRLD